jgi:cytidylate kinase
MVALQRRMIVDGRYVAEGRDIGTVVSPEAPLKVFLTASAEERARRRAEQTGEAPAAVLAAQEERDRRDESRQHSALQPAADAVELDTTNLSFEEVVDRVVELAADRGVS